MHISRHIALLCLFLLALTACSGGEEPVSKKAEAPELKASAPAKVVSASSVKVGEIVDMDAAGLAAFLEANKGKATLVMIWTTWCPSCKQQIPELEKLAKTHGDKVNILAMSLDETRSALERYLEKKPIDLPVVWGDKQIGRDHNVEAIPTLLIFDKSGKKIFGQSGVFPATMLGAMADKLAGE